MCRNIVGQTLPVNRFVQDNMTTSSLPLLNIAAVERETGLSKDVLRKWEARYGFPIPLRDSQGERIYPADQVHRLRLVKRLIDSGARPSALMSLADSELDALSQRCAAPPSSSGSAEADHLARLRADSPTALRRHFQREFLRQGLEVFVLDTLPELNQRVGDAWARGDLNIEREHAYTEVIQWLLRDALAQLDDPDGTPHILLGTLPDEQHGLGLLMAGALFALHGAHCLHLGPRMPMDSLTRAAAEQSANIVALSFSIAYPARAIAPALTELRATLAPEIEIWAGGAGIARLSGDIVGVRRLPDLRQSLSALSDWREAQAAGSTSRNRGVVT